MQHVQNVLAGAERVRAKIGTRTERIAPLLAAQRHAIGLARKRAGDRVIGPRLLRIGRSQAELLGLRPLQAIAQGLFEQLLLVQRFDAAVVRRAGRPGPTPSSLPSINETAAPMCSQTVSQAVQLNRSRFLASAIVVMVATASFPPPSDAPQFQPKQIAAKIHVAVDVDVVVACPAANQLRPLGPQELGGLNIGEPGKAILEVESLAFLGFCFASDGFHDRQFLQ